MFEDTRSLEAAEPAHSVPFASKSLTRRSMLRLLLSGGAAATMATGVLTACGGSSPTTTNVTLLTAGWPIKAMPTAAQQKADPFQKAYADVLGNWLKENPGVTIKATTTNIWDSVTITTAVASGTAPAWYNGTTIGNYQDEATRAAFVSGLAADTTNLYTKYNTEANVSDKAKEAWHASWRIDGRFYGAPSDFYLGRGIIYRRDRFQQAGLEEPKAGWTWADFRRMAKALTRGSQKGAAFQSTTISTMLAADQFDLLSRVPSPQSNAWRWRYNYTAKAAKWKEIVDIYRGMYFDDKSVLADVNYGDGDVRQAFARGDISMVDLLSISYPNENDGEVGSVAKRMGKPLGEIVGYVVHPNGLTGAFGNTQTSIGIVAFDPHLNTTALEKAYALHVFYYIGPGVIKVNQEGYKATPANQRAAVAASIYNQPYPTNKLLNSIPGIPGGFATYYGADVEKAMEAGLSIPLLPIPSQFIPVERNAGPTASALKDATSAMAFSRKNTDDILHELETTVNQQAVSIPSNVSPDAFVQGAKKYYAAISQFWQEHAPEFYTTDFEPYYQQFIAPNLK